MTGKFENTKKVQVRTKKKKRSKFTRFLRKAAHDKRYRAVFLILLLLVSFLIGEAYQKNVSKTYYTSLLENQKQELIYDYEAQLATQRENYELALDNLRDEYENPTPEQVIAEEAEWIAKVLYGNALNNSERDCRTLCWCVINRVDHAGYPDTIEGVVSQEKQWMGFNENNPIIQSLYDIAYEELTTWHNGYRPVTADYVFLSWSSKEIKLRDTFETGKDTKYWQMA